MKKIQIRYEWKGLGDKFRAAFVALYGGIGIALSGVAVFLMALFLVIANLAIRAYEYSVKAIRAKPCVAFVGLFIVMTVAIFATHASMKVKLTTAEYQRDSLEMKLQRYEQFKQ